MSPPKLWASLGDELAFTAWLVEDVHLKQLYSRWAAQADAMQRELEQLRRDASRRRPYRAPVLIELGHVEDIRGDRER